MQENYIPCAEFLPEFIHVFFLGDLLDHVQSLSYKLLLNHLQKFVLLKIFTTDVERQVIRIHNTTDEGKILGHHIFKVVSDEDTSHIQLDLIHLLAIFREKVVWGGFWHIED